MGRRLLRFAFTALSALSLLLCVGVCVLWVRSYWVSDYVIWSRFLRHEKQLTPVDVYWQGYVACSDGGVLVLRTHIATEWELPTWEVGHDPEPPFATNTVGDSPWSRMGFEF